MKERETTPEIVERLSKNLSEDAIRILGSLGLYSATEHYDTAEHPEDERWLIVSEN
jgi:hypothetical protein